MILDSLPDIPRVYTGLAEWSACLVYILILRKRMRPLPLIGLLAAGAVALVAFQLFAGTLPIWLWTVGMAGAVTLMTGLIAASARVSFLETGYFAARALVLAELVASLEWQLESFFLPVPQGTPVSAPTELEHLALMVLVYAVAFALAYLLERRHFPREQALAITGKDLMIATAIALATFFMSNISFLNANTPFSGRLSLEIFYIRTLVNLCGYAALYAQQEQRLEVRRAIEVDAMNHLLRNQHEQYLHSKRSIDRVNRKYHDLKHQIALIRAEENPELKATYLDELEGSIQDYERQVKTGNPVLDTLLTAKSMECAEKGITLTAVADGSVLEGIRAIDLSTILGNALDNAIESAAQVQDPERRLIRVAVYAQGELAMIRVENYYRGSLRWEGGQLATTKGDREDHGYGVASIRYTAEQYGGTATVTAEDDWFILRVLMPRQRHDAPTGGEGASAAATDPR